MPDVFVADCEMQKFCNSMPCQGYSTRLRFIEAKHPTRSFYLMKREELQNWFNCLSRENRAICSYCDQTDCYTCQSFLYIKNKLNKVVFSKQKIVVAAYYMGDPWNISFKKQTM